MQSYKQVFWGPKNLFKISKHPDTLEKFENGRYESGELTGVVEKGFIHQAGA